MSPQPVPGHILIIMYTMIVSIGVPVTSFAQEALPKVRPPDLGYGEQESREAFNRIPNFRRGGAPVDNRFNRDTMASQGILFPSAYIPEDPPDKHHLIYRNHMFFGHQLSYAGFGRVMVTLGVVEPLEDRDWEMTNIDDMLTASLSVGLWRSQDVRITASMMWLDRTGRRFYDSSERGGALNLVGDFVLTDWLVLGIGWMGYRPTSVEHPDWDTSQCKSRVEFINRSCFRPKRVERSWPQGGRWWQMYTQLTFYAPRGLFGKLELNTGQHHGTVLDLEGAIYGNEDPIVQAKRYADQPASWGALYGVPLSVQVALGWSNDYFGIQTGWVILPAGNNRYQRHGRETDNFRRQNLTLLPVLSMGVRWP